MGDGFSLRSGLGSCCSLALTVVDHDIVRLDVAVHDPVGVRKVEGLEQLKHVVTNVEIGQSGVEHLWAAAAGGCERVRVGARLR